jgi:outer membrane protein assembly factor BamD (BamD/ComL family)
MGKKRTWFGEHVHLGLALLITLPLAGCYRLPHVRVPLIPDRQLLNESDYQAALKENERLLALSGDAPPADEALFQLGYIHAHYANPNKDYEKAFIYFDTLVEDYPESPLTEIARMWQEFLTAHNAMRGELDKQERMLKKYSAESLKLKKALKKREALLEGSRGENRELRQEVERLNQVIRKSKQVDIEVEQKKRERGGQ